MDAFLDAAEISLPCGNCGGKIKKPVGWVKTNKEFTCPSCGSQTRFEADDFIRKIGDAGRGVDRLTKEIQGINKRLKRR